MDSPIALGRQAAGECRRAQGPARGGELAFTERLLYAGRLQVATVGPCVLQWGTYR